MNLINTTGITKPLVKLGNAVVMTVAPVANLLEMANESSLAWTESHAADVAAKTIERNAVRETVHANSLRRALAEAQRNTLETNLFVSEVQDAVDVNAMRARIHEAKRKQFHSLSEEAILKLAQKDNLTDADILRAAKVGITAPVATTTIDAPKSEFDLGAFTTK